MNRRLLMLIPMLAVAASITSLVVAQPTEPVPGPDCGRFGDGSFVVVLAGDVFWVATPSRNLKGEKS
jgi:hypothetical protein